MIRSFVCNMNMNRPSVKRGIKWQVSSNFQIYPGKTDDPPTITLKQKLEMVYSFTFYTALYIYLLSLYELCHLELSK